MSAGFEIEDGVLTKYTGDETEVVIPEGVVTIGKNAFYENKKITEIVMPDSVIKIDSNAFEGYTSLTNVTIPSGVTDIGSSTFRGCSSLTAIYCYPTIPPIAGSSIFNDTNNCPIYVPSGSVEAYKTERYWSDYANRIIGI